MKKEKNVITKEETIEESSVKIKKKFKSLKSWSKTILYVVCAAWIILLIAGIYDIVTLQKGEVNNVYDLLRPGVTIEDERITKLENELEEENSDNISISKVIKDDKNIGLFKFTSINGDFDTTEQNINSITKIYVFDFVFEMLSITACIIMIICLVKIFGEVENNGTPFVEKNIKYFNIISLVCFYLFCFGYSDMSVGLVSLILIEAFLMMFKYGCKLQKQVDETL